MAIYLSIAFIQSMSREINEYKDMKVNIKTIQDFYDEFGELEKILVGSNYEVDLGAKKFQFEGGDDFTVENLKLIFDGELKNEITIEQVVWPKAENSINCMLSYSSYGDGIEVPGKMLSTVPEEKRKKRKLLFWNKVKTLIQIPPKKTYWYSPKFGGIFDNFAIWGFCAILLNENEGLVVFGGAYY